MASPTWEREKGETELAYEAFLIYRDMGAERTQESTRIKLGRPAGYSRVIEDWSVRHKWVDRCRDFDNHLQAERDDVALAAVRKREARRLELQEFEWRLAVAHAARAEEMMKYPLVTRTLDDGKTVVKPARWSAKDAAAYSAVASKLGRSALDMDGAAPAPPEPPAPVTEEQMKAAEKTLDEWRRQQNQAMMTSESSPPPPTPDTSPTPSG